MEFYKRECIYSNNTLHCDTQYKLMICHFWQSVEIQRRHEMKFLSSIHFEKILCYILMMEEIKSVN